MSNKINQEQMSRHLSRRQNLFGKLLNIPLVQKVNDVLMLTVGRTYALFYGSLFYLITSLVVILICSYYGYDYNYFLGLMGFLGGFVVGIIIEIFLSILNKKS